MAINGVVDLLTNRLSNKYEISKITEINEEKERKKAVQIIEKILSKLESGKTSKAVRFAMERLDDWEDYADLLPVVKGESFLDIIAELSDLYEYHREYKKQVKCKEELEEQFKINAETLDYVASAAKSIHQDIQVRESDLKDWISYNGDLNVTGQ